MDNIIIDSDTAYYRREPNERPISRIYPVIDNDLARDNIENDLSAADLQDLYCRYEVFIWNVTKCLGFEFALAQRPDAMKRFSDLPKDKREEILQKAHRTSSKSEMQALVDEIADK